MNQTEPAPTVCVCNAVDTLRGMADRARSADETDALLLESIYQQDQAVFWERDVKLVVTSEPVAELAWQQELLDLDGVTNVSPRHRSGALFTDIMRDQDVLQAIVEYAGDLGRIRLVPHTTTPELWVLVDVLESQHSLAVELPESTRDQALRDRLDTKSGVRELAEYCGLSDGVCRTARGRICDSRRTAADAVATFLARGTSCIVKADRGEASIGLLIFHPDDNPDAVSSRLDGCTFYGDDPLVVEEYVHGDDVVFPSVEYAVPADPAEPPQLTHVCLMLFDGATELRGNVTASALAKQAWHTNLVAGSEIIASELQARGYQGHFGIDTVARQDGTVFLLDLNARRTGSTHVHDFYQRCRRVGHGEELVVGNYDFYGLPAGISLDEVLGYLGSLVASPRDGAAGVVPCELTGLRNGRLSCMIFAPSLDRFHDLVELVHEAVSTNAT